MSGLRRLRAAATRSDVLRIGRRRDVVAAEEGAAERPDANVWPCRPVIVAPAEALVGVTQGFDKMEHAVREGRGGPPVRQLTPGPTNVHGDGKRDQSIGSELSVCVRKRRPCGR